MDDDDAMEREERMSLQKKKAEKKKMGKEAILQKGKSKFSIEIILLPSSVMQVHCCIVAFCFVYSFILQMVR